MTPLFNPDNYADQLMEMIVKFYTNIEDKINQSVNSNGISEEFMDILEKVDNDLREAASSIPIRVSDNRHQDGI